MLMKPSPDYAGRDIHSETPHSGDSDCFTDPPCLAYCDHCDRKSDAMAAPDPVDRNAEERRRWALEMAHRVGGVVPMDPAKVVERAREFEAYVRGGD